MHLGLTPLGTGCSQPPLPRGLFASPKAPSGGPNPLRDFLTLEAWTGVVGVNDVFRELIGGRLA